MNPVSDTAKQDLSLTVIGAVAILLFFWLYSDFHPLPEADISLSKTNAEQQAIDYSAELGYESEVEPVTKFRINSQLLDSLQKQTRFKDFYHNPRHRELYPVFYWQTDLKIEDAEPNDGFIFGQPPAKVIEVELSESGKIIALRNNENILPDKIYRPGVINYAVKGDSLVFYSLSDDSLIAKSFEFQFNELADRQRSQNLNRNKINYLGRTEAQRMAEFYLEGSGWPHQNLSVSSIESFTIGELEGGRVQFQDSIAAVRQNIQVEVRVLPSGALVSLDYSHPSTSVSETTFATIKEGTRVIVLLIGAFWIIILLLMRFRLRLIDIKAATLVAVLAGMIVPLVIMLEQVYSHFNSFGTLSISFILPLLISIGFTAALSSVGFFAVTAISDSITRQNWVEKLRTVDLMRVGHFTNIPVGLTLVRGISYGFILSMLWCITLFLIPDSFITLDTQFEADSTYLPYLSQLLGNFVFYFLVAQVVFLIFIGLLRSTFKSSVAVVLTPALLFIIVYPFPFEVGSYVTEIIVAGVIGLCMGFIYLKEDFLTTFFSLFIFVSILSTSPGWLVENSPDAGIFYAMIFLTLVGFIYGGYSIYKGKKPRELPKFVPDYIQELAQEDRIRQELQIARKVQQSFLPAKTPSIEGYDIAAICKPAYETGGDYYDFIQFSNNRIAVTIGDVSGKGIQAAFFMTFTKGVLHALCSDYQTTIDILVKTNNMFRNNANRGTFISLIFGIIDIQRNLFRFSRAGHNPLLYLKSSENKLYQYQPEGLAIGMAGEETFVKHISEEQIELEKNDLLILFTDGVVESISKTNKLYGDQRLQNLITQNSQLSAEELLRLIEEDLEKFGEKSEQHDDLTMIVIKKK